MEPIACAVKTPAESLGPFHDLSEVRAVVNDYRAVHGDDATAREVAVFCLQNQVGAGGWMDVQVLFNAPSSG